MSRSRTARRSRYFMSGSPKTRAGASRIVAARRGFDKALRWARALASGFARLRRPALPAIVQVNRQRPSAPQDAEEHGHVDQHAGARPDAFDRTAEEKGEDLADRDHDDVDNE